MSQSCLSLDNLRRLLGDRLPEGDELAAADHLAGCERCRSELDSLAGNTTWWNEIHQQLTSVSGEERSRLLGRPSRSSPDLIGLSEEAANFDFAVDFLDPCDNPTALGRLGPYEILEVIGRGGMGIVLKGFQSELNRYVAVKVLAPHLATSATARRRFAREAQATAAVVHPHVLAIHAVDATGKLPFLVMPFVACESLEQRIARVGALDVKDVLRIGMQAARGLAAAHAQGIVHRDVKPANILLEANVDRVMLTDFGLARAVDDATLTRSGVIAGTPQFMSPEQARGEAVDHRSDLFSLGSVLYMMIAGRPPFRAESTLAVLRRITDTQPRPLGQIQPETPSWLARVVEKLHAKAPSDRIGSASELADLLEQCLAHVQQPQTTPLPLSLQPKFQPISLWTKSGIALTFVVTGLALGWLVRLGGNPNQEPVRNAGAPASQSEEQVGTDAPNASVIWEDGIAEQLRDLGKAEMLLRLSIQMAAAPMDAKSDAKQVTTNGKDTTNGR